MPLTHTCRYCGDVKESLRIKVSMLTPLFRKDAPVVVCPTCDKGRVVRS